MKTTLATLLALAALATGLHAQSKVKTYDAPPRTGSDTAIDIKGIATDIASGFTFEATGTLTTKYVFRGTERQEFSIQPHVLLQHASGFHAGAFANLPFEHASETEYNINLGYAKNLGKLTLDAGAVVYFVNDLPGRDWSQEFYIGATYYLPKNFGFRYYMYYDTRLEALTNEFAIGYAIPLSPRWSNIPASIQISLYAGYVDADDFLPDLAGGKVRESYSYYGASIEVPVQLTKQISSNIGARYGQTRQYFENGFQDANFWAFASLGYNF